MYTLKINKILGIFLGLFFVVGCNSEGHYTIKEALEEHYIGVAPLCVRMGEFAETVLASKKRGHPYRLARRVPDEDASRAIVEDVYNNSDKNLVNYHEIVFQACMGNRDY